MNGKRAVNFIRNNRTALCLCAVFLGMYLFLTRYTIRQYRLTGLLLAAPPVLLLFVSGRENPLRRGWIVLVALVLCADFFSALVYDDCGAVSDPALYPRVIARSSLPAGLTEAPFPARIPPGADHVSLAYHPLALGQGGQSLQLAFTADADNIASLASRCREKAVWAGKPGGAPPEYGAVPEMLNIFDYRDTSLPADFTIYVLSARKKAADWNHRACSLAAVSQQRGTALFAAETW